MNVADQFYVKKMNLKTLFNEIIKNSPISRAELSKVTGLNKSTVSSQINTLIDRNLVFEIGQGQSSGGRRPVMLVFNKKAGYAIGIDLGAEFINGILTDLEGSVIASKYKESAAPFTEEAIEMVFSIIEELISEVPESHYGLVGIGVSVPGIVDKRQDVVFTPNSNWIVRDLKSMIEQKFFVPVLIENEANAGAYGEKVFGAAKNLSNIIYVSIGTGIGIGIIINHDLYRGYNGFSGEMGHMTIDFNGPKCSCGNRGCWELYASERVLYNSSSKRSLHLTRNEVIKLAQNNDADTLNALQKFGFYIGVGLTSVLNTFNPQAVIIRNSIIESQPIVLNSIKSAVTSRIYSNSKNEYDLLPSALGQNAPALGTSSIVVERFLELVTE